jgi:hypothetical protein
VPYATGIPMNIDADSLEVLVDGVEFIHETQQLNTNGLATE